MWLSDLRSSWRATNGHTTQLTATAAAVPASSAAPRAAPAPASDVTVKLTHASSPERGCADSMNRNTAGTMNTSANAARTYAEPARAAAASASPPHTAPATMARLRVTRSWALPPTRGCIIIQAATTAHQACSRVHHAPVCSSQAGTLSSIVTNTTLNAKRDSNCCSRCSTFHAR